jgi:hypothetical protein
MGIAGLLAYLRRVRKRAPAIEPPVDTRAQELRRKLDETRAEADEPMETTEPAEPEPAGDDLDERRRQVHELGRAAAEQMRGSGDD